MYNLLSYCSNNKPSYYRDSTLHLNAHMERYNYLQELWPQLSSLCKYGATKAKKRLFEPNPVTLNIHHFPNSHEYHPWTIFCQKAEDTNFGTNQKPEWNFLFVNTRNLYAILHHFQVIMAYWLKLSLLTGVPLFNPLIWGESQNSELQNSASKTRNITAPYHILINWTV